MDTFMEDRQMEPEKVIAGKYALIVDDEQDTCEFLTDALTSEGYEVRCTHSGEDGVSAMREWGPDLVLLDLTMPAGGGLRVAERVRAFPRTATTPIIFLTARDSDIDAVAVLAGWVGRALWKPPYAGA